MPRLRIYTDTSVIGGCFDPQYRIPSRRLIDQFRAGRSIIVLSDQTLLELRGAPLRVRRVLDRIPPGSREGVELTEEAGNLARAYLDAKVLTERQLVDAQHIAMATIAQVDVLVSWNFKHIVNLKRIHGYNTVNVKQGYAVLEIRSPLEVIGRD